MDGTNSDLLPSQPPDLSWLHDRLGGFDAELAKQRYAARSRNGAAEATVDGHGGMVALKIDDRALHNGHPEQLGPAIVEAITASRAQASEAANGQLQAAMDPNRPQNVPSHGNRRPTAERAAPPRERSQKDERTSIWRGKSQNRRDPDDLENEVPLFDGLR